MGVWFDVGILIVYLIFFLGTLVYLKFFQKEKRIWPYVAVIAIGLTLAYSLNRIHFVAEKVHFLEYAILGTLLIYSIEQRTLEKTQTSRRRSYDFKIPNFNKCLFVVVLGFIIGLGDELIQGLFPRRFFDWRDVGMNGIGIAMGIGFTFAIQPKIIVKSEE
jgi:VanZ family protein